MKALLLFGFAALNLTFTCRSVAQAWVTNNPMLIARWWDTATVLTNGDLLIAGGTVSNDYANNTFDIADEAEVYDPTNGTPTVTGYMNDSRTHQAAVLLTNGQVLVTGGGGDATSEIYDPGTASWINWVYMNDEREYHICALLPNGQALAAGGFDDNEGEDISSAEVYDPGSTTWTSVAPMTYACDSMAFAVLTNGTVLVCGGYSNGNTVNNAVIYYPKTQTWTNTAPMNEARQNHSATLLQNGQVLVEGGSGDNTAEIYDPGTKSWTYVADMNDGRYYCNAVILTNGQVLVSGDENPDVEIYDPVRNVWSYTAQLPFPAYFQTESAMSNGQVVVTGGTESNYNGPGLNVIETFGLTGTPYSGAGNTPSLTVSDSPLSGAAPLPAQFSSPGVDSEGNTVTSWSWNFGDGSSSSAQNPQHTYYLDGSYTPTLTAYSTYGSVPLIISNLEAITVANSTPSIGSWIITGSLTQNSILTNGIIYHTATLLNNGEVLAAGGEGLNSYVYTNSELYNPATGTWSPSGSMNFPRYYHTATLLTNGLVLVAGGATNVNNSSSATTSAELYNPTNGQWTLTGSMHTARYAHTATLLPDGTVLVAGGESTNAYPNPNITATAEIYHPTTGLWTVTNSMITARFSHTATLLQNGEVLVAGGEVTNVFLVTPLSEIYDPASGAWEATGNMADPAVNYAAALLLDGTVLAAGGDIDEGFGDSIDLVADNFAQLYSPNYGSWSSLTNMYSTRDFCTATLLTNDTVLVTGSQGYDSAATNSAELYLPFNQTWMRAAAMNVPRNGATATLLTNGLVLVTGGENNDFRYIYSAELYSSGTVVPPIILVNLVRSTNTFSFTFQDVAGSTNNVFGTTNLALPFGDWNHLGTATEVSPGNFEFTDTNIPTRTRFYRVRAP